MEERLQKYMARCGVASRRKCEIIIKSGNVRVNDSIITELGSKIDPEKDVVKVDNKIVKPEERKIYIALNKPIGYVSTVKDERGRKTIIDLIDIAERIYPIGRLDYDTSGLILLTNDGSIYNKVIHPRQSIDKVYIALIKGHPTQEEIKKFCTGVDIGGYITASANFKVLRKVKSDYEVKITIHEGKNRQVRKMCDAIGHPVISLKRISIGDIKLNNLNLGKWCYLSDDEIAYIKGL
jgi:23S rRNA pseudouridine2605 synthase